MGSEMCIRDSVKAAGCTMSGSIHDVINNLALRIEAGLKECGA